MEQVNQLKAMRDDAWSRIKQTPDYKLASSLDALIADLERALDGDPSDLPLSEETVSPEDSLERELSGETSIDEPFISDALPPLNIAGTVLDQPSSEAMESDLDFAAEVAPGPETDPAAEEETETEATDEPQTEEGLEAFSERLAAAAEEDVVGDAEQGEATPQADSAEDIDVMNELTQMIHAGLPEALTKELEAHQEEASAVTPDAVGTEEGEDVAAADESQVEEDAIAQAMKALDEDLSKSGISVSGSKSDKDPDEEESKN